MCSSDKVTTLLPPEKGEENTMKQTIEEFSPPMSEEFPHWQSFSPRDVPFTFDILSPAAEIASVLQSYHSQTTTLHNEIEQIHLRGLQALAQQAVFIIQFQSALAQYESNLEQPPFNRIHRHFRVLKDQMLDALTQSGLEIQVPLGKPFEETADWVHVQGWRHHPDYPIEMVVEVLEPIILFQGKLIRQGSVIMGAPSPGKKE